MKGENSFNQADWEKKNIKELEGTLEKIQPFPHILQSQVSPGV